MAQITMQKSLFVAREETDLEDPSPDGSAMYPVPFSELSELSDLKAGLPTSFGTGRGLPTADEESSDDGWSFTMKTPLIGLLSAAGDGVNASTVSEDWMGMLLRNVFGAPTTTAGEGTASSSDTTHVTLDGAVWAAQQYVPIFAAAAGFTQWRHVLQDLGGAAYLIEPPLVTQPGASDVAYGQHRYQIAPSALGGGVPSSGNLLRFQYVQSGQSYDLGGGYCTSFKMSADVNQMVMCEFAFSGVTKTAATKGSLAQAIAAPATTPIKLHRVGSYFGTADLSCKSVSVDFGIAAQRLFSSSQPYGFGGWQTTSMSPTVSINPLFDTSFETFKREVTKSGLFLQFGEGAFASGVLNTVGLHFSQAQVRKSDGADVDGVRRSGLEFFASDKVRFDISNPVVFAQFCRA